MNHAFRHAFRPVVGIVGGIGSGKSAVARALARLGCEVAVSDDLARVALAESGVRARLVEIVGPEVVGADGAVDRAALARAIFGRSDVRRAVESVMHPRIEALRHAQFARASPAAPAFVIDAPLLLEVGLDRECDAVVYVDAPDEVRLARVARDRGWNAAELARRERAQLALSEKRARASDVVVNDGDGASLDETRLDAAVAELLAAIVARGRRAAVRIAPT